MLLTALLFMLATISSLVVLAAASGFLGFFAALWVMVVLKSPTFLLLLLFAWVPIWLWIAAIRRVWYGSRDPELPVDVGHHLVEQGRVRPASALNPL